MSTAHSKRRRQSIRLPGHDYASPGMYFVTICVRLGECLLGGVAGDEMELTALGRLAHDFWAEIPAHFAGVTVDSSVTMPNHVHAIIVIQEPGGETPLPPGGATPLTPGGGTPPLRPVVAAPTLGQIVAYYKYQSTLRINLLRQAPGLPFWQRNYWEHLLRSEAELHRIRDYIATNPARWQEDRMHPGVPRTRSSRRA